MKAIRKLRAGVMAAGWLLAVGVAAAIFGEAGIDFAMEWGGGDEG